MSVSPDQLGEIHRKIVSTFHNHPAISISPSKGDPPEQYEITYTIAGYCRTGRGEPRLADEHRVELTIPFGFPHFPPSCKPKTDIFHPDFDPAAVCLGDFWQPGSEIAELVIHLGRLINGEIYSSDNAFNEEAAKWYGEHRHLFPLASISWQPVSPPESPAEKSLSQIDTIEDDDLASDFDLLSLDGLPVGKPSASSGGSPKVEVPAAEDLSYLQLLHGRKKYFKLRQHFADHPPRSSEAQELFTRCSAEIDRAEELYRSARTVESAGNLKNASRLYAEVGTIASDYPGLDNDQRRTDESLALLKKDSAESPQRSTLPELAELETGEEPPPPPLKGNRKNGNKRDLPGKPPAPVAKVPSQRFGTKALVLTLGGLAAVAAGSYLAVDFYDARTLKTAGEELARCRSEIDAQRFEEAKGLCESALGKSKPMLFLNNGKGEELAKSINDVLGSETLSQGLAGNILVDGKYLPRKEAEALIAFNKLRQEAEAMFDEQKWGEAEERYRQLLTLVEKGGPKTADAVKVISDRLAFLRFAKVFASANLLIGQSRWQEATAELQKAKALLEALPEEERQKHQLELNAAMAKCNFEEFRRLGDEFFSKADWRSAINTYKSVLPTAEENSLASRETLAELKENIARAELYAAIDMGNKAFASGNWEAAIAEYNKAGTILSSHLETLKQVDAQFTRRRIDRIILQTMVIRDRQAAQTAEMDQKDPVAARNIHRQLVATLNNSGFVGEEEFAEVKKSSLVSIEALERKIYLNERERYLRDNFRKLFGQNYPAAVAENLTNVQIFFVKEADGKLIFKMQCQETGPGRPLTLVMFYAYDKSASSWAFHSEPQ